MLQSLEIFPVCTSACTTSWDWCSPPHPEGAQGLARKQGSRWGKADTRHSLKSAARIETLEDRGHWVLGGRWFSPRSSSPSLSASCAEQRWECPRAKRLCLLSHERGEAGVICLSKLVINFCSQEGMHLHFLGSTVCWQETKRQKCQLFPYLENTGTPSQSQALPSHPRRHSESTWDVCSHCQHSDLPKFEGCILVFSGKKMKQNTKHQQGNPSPCSFKNPYTYKHAQAHHVK